MIQNVFDYMAVVIEDNGQTSYLGYDFSFSFHDACLIDFLQKKYAGCDLFKKINYMQTPSLPIYYLNKLGYVVFTNVSVYEEKRGMLYMPDSLTDKQIKSLKKLLKKIWDFNVYVEYDLVYDDFVLSSEFILDDKAELKSFCNKRLLKHKEKYGNGLG